MTWARLGCAGVPSRHREAYVEFGARRDGDTAEVNDDGTKPHGSLVGYLAEATVGYTPNGKFASAHQLAHLKKGLEILGRFNWAHIDQPAGEQAGFGGTARFWGVELGVAGQIKKQLRLQVDAAYQWFGSHDYGDNAGSKRVWAEIWGVWRL